jgi:hypothetical protein
VANFNGDDFKAVDEDAYAEDRPMSTFLDHATRNNLYACGRFGSQCSYSERLDAYGAAATVYSGNPSTFRGLWIIRVSPGCEGFEYTFSAAGGPSDASGTVGEAWLEVIHPRDGVISGTKQSITNTADATTYKTYTLDLSFGEALTNESVLAVAVMYQSAAYSTEATGVTLKPRADQAIADSTTYTRSQMGSTDGNAEKVEVIYDEGSISNSQYGSPVVASLIEDGNIRDLTYIASPGGELREKRSGYDPYSQTLIRAHDSTSGAQIAPEYDRGGGEAFRASESVFGRWHLTSIGTQFADKPNGDWDEFQRWIYVESGNYTRDVPFTALNDEVRIFWSVPIIAYDDDLDDSVLSEDPVVSTTDSVSMQLEVYNLAGSKILTDAIQPDVPFYARGATRSYPFFAQMEVRESFKSPEPRWTFREGQLFNVESGKDERKIVEAIYSTADLTGLTAGDQYRARIQISASIEGNVVVVGQPVIQQYVTQTTES